MSTPWKISVGVIVSNKQSELVAALQSILDQTLLQDAAELGVTVELIAMADRCSVDAAEVLIERERFGFAEDGPVQLMLEEVAGTGFSNALNSLAHTYSRKDADYIFFVNAGVVVDQPDAFECMLDSISKDYDMKLIAPPGKKHIAAIEKKTFLDHVNLAVTRVTAICQAGQVRGHCFCARAKTMRTIWLPRQFPGAVDGLLRKLIVSDMVGALDNPVRIGVAEDAGYTFKAERSFPELVFCRLRQIIGQAFVGMLIEHLKQMRLSRPDINLTNYLKARDDTDPAWLERLLQVKIHDDGLGSIMPPLWSRFSFWKNPKIGLFVKIAMLPVAGVASVFDIPVFLTALVRLKTGRITDVRTDLITCEIE